MGVRHLLLLIHGMICTENVFLGMNIGFCIDEYILSHKKMNAKRNLCTKTIMIVIHSDIEHFGANGTSVWSSGREGTEMRVRDHQ
jgi:hypothetical protein